MASASLLQNRGVANMRARLAALGNDFISNNESPFDSNIDREMEEFIALEAT